MVQMRLAPAPDPRARYMQSLPEKMERHEDKKTYELTSRGDEKTRWPKGIDRKEMENA